jgi:asparagine synthase (glutamine-hydrolysing)
MCGICGRLNFDPDRPVDRATLRRMMDVVRHRGPDGSGQYVSGPVGLGHRRLSIIDLDTGAQPMSNEDGRIVVVYNGEIYNFRALRRELEAAGHRFASASDTEVIVHLYEQEGDHCVARLRGMFAFALWDGRKGRLLLARDRVGVKPLYYASTGRALVFASELKSLLADGEVARNVNPRAIDRFLTYYYLPGTETPFEGVQKLAPGHFLTVEEGSVNLTRYWDLRFERPVHTASFGDAVAELQQLLRRTVADHMISDVPVGVLLSGGVDSTGVLAYAAEHAVAPIHTFTIGFAGAEFADERPYARLASRTFGTIHHETSMSAAQFRDLLPEYVWHMEELVCEPPAIALHCLARLASQSSVKVLLSGEGGDEAFGGYQTYRNLLMLERLKRAAGPSKGLLRRTAQMLGQAGLRRIGRYGPLIDIPLAQYYLSRTASPFTPFNRLKRELYRPDFAVAVDHAQSSAPTADLFGGLEGIGMLDRMLYVDTKTWLPDDLLLKADKMTMAASVELRVPLLDFQVLEFAASLPEHYKVQGWRLKRILKAALAGTVPEAILNRKKTGFPVPYGTWLRCELREFVADAILSHDSGVATHFRPAAVAKLLDRHWREGTYPKEVFCLLILALWHRQFVHAQPLASAA